MLPLPPTGAEVESLVRAQIAQRVAAIAGIGRCFTETFLVSGKQQFVERFGIEATDGETEARYALAEFAGFEDTPRGCDEDPHYYLVYRLRAVFEFAERANGSCSADDVAGFVMRLREAFLRARDLGVERIICEPLVMTKQVTLEEDNLTGIWGYVAGFRVKVEVVSYG